MSEPVEGRLRAAVADAIFGVYDEEPRSPQSVRADLRAADAAIAVVLDHAIEQIEARRAKRLHVKALEGFDEALAVLAEMRGDDA